MTKKNSITEEDIQYAIKGMEVYGGNFYKRLAALLEVADIQNREIILSNWGIIKYIDFGKYHEMRNKKFTIR